MDSYRLKVLKKLTAAFEEITVANGYQNDLAGKVFRGRLFYGDDDPIPMISILEHPEPADQADAPRSGPHRGPTRLELIVQGFVEDDWENPTDPAYGLLADVQKRLIEESRKEEDSEIFGESQVTSLEIGAGRVRPPDEISGKAYFWLTVVISIAEDLSNPFA